VQRKRTLPFILAAALLAALGAGNTRAQPNEPNAACKALWADIGWPTYVAPAPDVIVVCHMRYAASFNRDAKTPDWVIERLTKEQVTGPFDRPTGGFTREEAVGDANPRSDAYSKSGFELGHLAPSEDFNQKCEWMKESFRYSNAVPQIGAMFNKSIWKGFEEEVRNIAAARGEVYVITGRVARDGTSRSRKVTKQSNDCGKAFTLTGPPRTKICMGSENQRVACPKGVTVPIAMYKIIYEPGSKTAHAYVLANKNHTPGKDRRAYLEKFQVSVAALQRLTSVEFFGALSPADRANVVDKCAREKPWQKAPAKPKSVDCN
jgi:endonuclease G